MAAGGFAAGAPLEVIGGREDHQISLEVVVFGFESRRRGGLVAVHSFIVSSFPFSCVGPVRNVRREPIVRIGE